jgi:hypothetical protein
VVFVDHSWFEQAVVSPRVEEFVASRPLKLSIQAFCQGEPGSMNIAAVPLNLHRSSMA